MDRLRKEVPMNQPENNINKSDRSTKRIPADKIRNAAANTPNESDSLKREAASLTQEEHRARMQALAKMMAKERYQREQRAASSDSKAPEIDSIDDFIEKEYMGGSHSAGSQGSDPSSDRKAARAEKKAARAAKKEAKKAHKAVIKSEKANKSAGSSGIAGQKSSGLHPGQPGASDDRAAKLARLKEKLIVFGKKLIPSKLDKEGNPITKKRFAVRVVFRAILYMFIVGIAFTLITIITAPSIDPANIYDQISTPSVIYDDQEKKVDTISAGEDRQIVDYDDLPKNLVNAFVALEDKTFWTHHGFNWTRMFGAVLQSMTGSGGISGTSTITQQLARNVYLPDIKSERSIRRKIIEMYYAARIEHSLSKKEILAAYLNSIYFGNGNYGIEAAAQNYFSKNVSELTLSECAALAALPQSPDTYALLKPAGSEANDYTTVIQVDGTNYLCNDISKERRQTCLKLMKDQGYITASQYNVNVNKNLVDFLNPTIAKEDENKTSYFSDYMVEEIVEDLEKEYDLSAENAEKMVYNGGLKIYSTMDSEAQETVEDAFADSSNFPSLLSLNKDSNGNIVTESGAISLYSYDTMFGSNGNFTLKKGEFTKNSDGSLTIKAGKRLNIYETTVSEGTDYSIEFKPSYVTENGSFYIYPNGYINVPMESKKEDSSGNVTISADWLKKNTDKFKDNGSTWTITSKAYTMSDKVVQPQGAMVITEVGTGEIKAMVGGRGIKGSNLYNRATNPRQPGSSIKPLALYSAALQKSYEDQENGEKFDFVDPGNDTQGADYGGDYFTAGSTIIDEPITFNGKVWPTNSYGGYEGSITMRRAMQLSCNVAAVKIYEQVGGSYAAKMVKKFGITTLVTDKSKDTNDMNAAALALGGLSKGVTPLEMAQAYASFPNGGTRNSSIAYTKVLDRNGKTLLTSESTETKVMDEGVAFIMTDMMKSVVSSGTGTGAALTGVEAGGKTGTTTNNYDIWFDGFTPTYAASLWIGTDVNIELSSTSSGAAALWGRIMNNVTKAKEGEYKEAPDDVVVYNGEYYTEGTSPGEGVSAKDYGTSSGSGRYYSSGNSGTNGTNRSTGGGTNSNQNNNTNNNNNNNNNTNNNNNNNNNTNNNNNNNNNNTDNNNNNNNGGEEENATG